MRRWLLRIAVVLLALAVLVVVAVRTAPVRDALRRQAVAALADAIGAEVRIRGLRGSVFRSLVLEDVAVIVDGRTIVRAPRITLAYHLLPLVRGELRIARIAADAPRIRLVRTAHGWVLPVPPPSSTSSGSSSLRVLLDEIRIRDGRVEGALLDATPPRRFAATALALDASARLADGGQRLDVTSLALVPRGVALSPVQASLALDATSAGRIHLARLDVASARSHVTATGFVEPGTRVDATLALDPLSAADVRALIPELALRADVRGDVAAVGPWSAIDGRLRAALAPGGDVALGARLDAAATPLRWDAHAELAAVDPGAAIVGLTRASLTGELAARGAGFDAGGLADYRAALRDSAIEGRAVDRLTLAGTAHDRVHRVRARVRAPAGDASLRARVGLRERIDYVAAVRYRLARLDLLVPSTWGWVIGAAHVRGDGTEPGRRTATARIAVATAAVHGVPIERVDLRAALAQERVTLETLAVRSTDVGLDARASGRAGVDGRDVALDVTARADLDAVGLFLATPLHGALTLGGAVRGDTTSLGVRGNATIQRPAYGSLSAEQASLQADLTGVGGATAAGRLALTAAAVRAGTGPAYATRGDVDWRRRGGDDRADVTVSAATDDGRTQRARAIVERTAARTTATVQELQLAPADSPVWRLAEPAIVRVDSAVITDGMTLVAGSQRIAARGRIALDGGTSDASLTVDALDLGPVCALASGPTCSGRFAGRATLGGTPAAPVLTITSGARGVAVDQIAYGDLELRGDYGDRRAKLAATLRHPEAGTLTLDGTVPVDLAWAGAHPDLGGAPLSLALRAKALDLTFVHALAPWTIKRTAGRLDVDLAATGTRAAPRLRGDAALDDGTLELAATGIAYEHVRARLVADGTRLVAQELHAEAGDGRADVTGSVELAAAPRALDLRVHLDRFYAARTTAYEAAVSGDLRLLGSIDAPDVSGKVDVDHGTIRPAALPASGPGVAPPDPTIVVVGRPVSAEETKPEVTPTLAAATRVAVTIEIRRNAWIRRTDADIEIGGKLEVTKAPDDGVRIVGEIRLLRGWYAFQGRRFSIEQEGRIVFTGASPPEPTFDITAVYSTRDYRVLVHITGSAEKPTLELTSEPALDQADILAVLLFGKPARDLGRSESAALQQKALALAAGYVVPELRTSVMNALGVETLDVQMPEGSQAGSVTAGRYVAEDVFVSLGQEFGRRVAQTVGLEYYLGKSVSVRGSTSTRGDSALDLLWRYRY
jgi:autotransporter translocation and assembly factor TamB